MIPTEVNVQQVMQRVVDQFGDAAVLTRPVLEDGTLVDLELEYGNAASQHLLIAGPATTGDTMLQHATGFLRYREYFENAWFGSTQRFEFDNRSGVEPNIRRAVWEMSLRRIDDHLLMVVVDTTEHHEYRSLIEQVGERQRSMLDRLLESATLWDPVRNDRGELVDMVLAYMNPPTEAIAPALRLGMRHSEQAGESHEPVMEWVRHIAQNGGSATTEFSNADHRFGNTTVRHGLLRGEWMDGQMAIFLRDETQLVEALDHLGETVSQLASARDDERSRLAEALHDGPLQQMIGVQLQLYALAEQQDGELAATLNRLAVALGEAGNSVRSQSFAMFSHRLPHEHLGDAVRAEANRRLEGLQVEMEFHDHIGRRRIPDEVQRLVVRTVGELVSNVVRHADASHLTVTVACDGRWLRATVHDDGVGIDDTAKLGFGLSLAHVQVQDAGGFLTLERGPEGGTEALLTVPVRRSATQQRPIAALGSPAFGSRALGWFR